MRRTIRQTLEGMTLAFDPTAVPGLAATIQFTVTGAEPGTYHLEILDGRAVFKPGRAATPTLTITTPADVWSRISEGELTGPEAFHQRLFRADGDVALLLQMSRLFKPRGAVSFEVRGQRPPGPVRLGGMYWLGIAMLPWALHWLTVGRPGAVPAVQLGVPFVVAAAIVVYRSVFHRPTWLELGGLAYFGTATAALGVGATWPVSHGLLASHAALGAIWLGTAVGSVPASADYSKWKYVPALWTNSSFVLINAGLTVLWGWVFVLTAAMEFASAAWPRSRGVLSPLAYLLPISAAVLTIMLPGRGDRIRIARVERDVFMLRAAAACGVAVAAMLAVATWAGDLPGSALPGMLR